MTAEGLGEQWFGYAAPVDNEPLEVFVVMRRSATQASAFIDLRRDLEGAQRRAVQDAGRPLAFEAAGPDVWEARGANKRIYRVERREI